MFGLAFRRQLLLAVVAISAVVVQNAVAGGLDDEVARMCVELGVLCLAPAVFAWSIKAYRMAAGILAVVLTLVAIRGAVGGDASFVPVAIVACLTLMPVRWSPSGTMSDVWFCAGKWRTQRPSESHG